MWKREFSFPFKPVLRTTDPLPGLWAPVASLAADARSAGHAAAKPSATEAG